MSDAAAIPAAAACDVHEILRETFGYAGFRGKQEAVITRILAGQNTLALMRSGAGSAL